MKLWMLVLFFFFFLKWDAWSRIITFLYVQDRNWAPEYWKNKPYYEGQDIVVALNIHINLLNLALSYFYLLNHKSSASFLATQIWWCKLKSSNVLLYLCKLICFILLLSKHNVLVVLQGSVIHALDRMNLLPLIFPLPHIFPYQS